MEYLSNYVSDSSDIEKGAFYRKTYSHVALAILVFIGVETLLIQVVPESIIIAMVSSKFLWLGIIGAFWLIGSFTDRLVFSANKNTQYLGLGLYILIEAIIFLPLIYIAYSYTGGNLISQAAIITLAMFSGLTAVVFLTNKDFSFLRSALVVGGFIALGLIVAGTIFGFDLGLWFSVAMIVLASGGILYQTSQLKDHFETTQYVGAALKLFASIMLLFWYVLRLLMSRK